MSDGSQTEVFLSFQKTSKSEQRKRKSGKAKYKILGNKTLIRLLSSSSISRKYEIIRIILAGSCELDY